MQDAGAEKAQELIDNCQRNCLLVLLLSYLPMPQMTRSKGRATPGWCSCMPRRRQHNFAGSMQLLHNSSSLTVARSLITAASQANVGSVPVFSLKKLMQDDASKAATAVHAHAYSKEEAELAKDTIEMLFTVSSPSISTGGDHDMVRDCSLPMCALHYVPQRCGRRGLPCMLSGASHAHATHRYQQAHIHPPITACRCSTVHKCWSGCICTRSIWTAAMSSSR